MHTPYRLSYGPSCGPLFMVAVAVTVLSRVQSKHVVNQIWEQVMVRTGRGVIYWFILICSVIWAVYAATNISVQHVDIALWALIAGVWAFGRFRPTYHQEWRLELRQLYLVAGYFLVALQAIYFLVRLPTNTLVALVMTSLMAVYFASFYLVGRVLSYNKRYDEAHRFLDKMLASFPHDSRLLTQKASAYLAQEQYELCIRYATRAIEAHLGGREKSKTPSAVSAQTDEAFYLRTSAYSGLHDGASALQDAELLVRAEPNAPYGYFNRGMAMLYLNDFEEAAEDFEHTLGMTLFPFQRAVVENNLGLAAYCLRDFGAAMFNYRNALEQSLTGAEKRDFWPSVYTNMAVVHFVQGDVATAWQLVQTAYEINPQSRDARVALAVMYAYDRAWSSALDLWQDLIAEDERFAHPTYAVERYYRWTPPMAELTRHIVARL